MDNTELTQQTAKGTKMTFEQWKQKNHPGWYLNDQQQDEELFDQYLKSIEEDNLYSDIVHTLCSLSTDTLRSLMNMPEICRQICIKIIERREGK